MIIDLNTVDEDLFKDKTFDVCICGAGVAGVTLAHRLSKKFNVLLLEAGGYNYSPESQSVYQGSNIGRDYFDLAQTRLRYLGGTSNHWAGMCRLLDSYDFQAKSYLDYSGWPITINDLNPYVEETKSILDISIKTNVNKQFSSHILPGSRYRLAGFKRIQYFFSPPTRFGQKYREDLERTPNLWCCLNANLVNIRLNENLASVKELDVRNYSNRLFKIHARVNVLAAGGIENPRILLNCSDQMSVGIGNEHGSVGRFFAEHPHHTVGEFILTDHVRNRLLRSENSHIKALRFFSPTMGLMQQENILNFGLRFHPLKPDQKFSFQQRLKAIACDAELSRNPDQILRSDGAPSCLKQGVLRIASEQAPNPSSRVSLGSQRDRFGNRRAALDWQLSDIDKHTIQRAVIRFGMAFARMNLGRVRIADWLLDHYENLELPGIGEDEVGGHHHMGTTRMANSPRDGVVDLNQKVFGIDNLYVAGSSVFATSGHANPTFTIVQMSLRLAEHINHVLSYRAAKS